MDVFFCSSAVVCSNYLQSRQHQHALKVLTGCPPLGVKSLSVCVCLCMCLCVCVCVFLWMRFADAALLLCRHHHFLDLQKLDPCATARHNKRLTQLFLFHMKRSLSGSQKQGAELYSWSAVPRLPALTVFHTSQRCTPIKHHCKRMSFQAPFILKTTYFEKE